MRQITRAFVMPDFDGFSRPTLSNLYYVGMTEYEKVSPSPRLLTTTMWPSPLAKVIADAGLAQLHAAETEKYPHVTFYFNEAARFPSPKKNACSSHHPKLLPTTSSPK
jgi:2,3-bisphosphoglycerate-independent phosphoglycerate mutase